MNETHYDIRSIGVVRSALRSREECPKQGWEGAPEAWLEIDREYADALYGLTAGDEILVLTWLHEARRDVLKVRSRGDQENPLQGVFSLRSPHRPNPVGLHRVEIMEIEGVDRLRVYPLEVIDGTPIIDIKPVVPECEER
jgi:tRNA-Thr(GGU) m(6)t(6)A37 methyltransferase TsaA